MKKSILALDGIEVLSNEQKKSIFAGNYYPWGDPGLPDLGQEPTCGNSWSEFLGPYCTCVTSGLIRVCGQCVDSRIRSVSASVGKTC